MTELIDLVNSEGEIVEIGVTRDDISNYDGLYMQIIIAAIFNSEGEVNVHERAPQKSHAGYTDLVCGGVISGESALEAAMREIPEEAGGIKAEGLVIARKGVNEYGRYCWLIAGLSDDIPDPAKVDPDEVSNPRTENIDSLKTSSREGTLKLVEGLITDVEDAQRFLQSI